LNSKVIKGSVIVTDLGISIGILLALGWIVAKILKGIASLFKSKPVKPEVHTEIKYVDKTDHARIAELERQLKEQLAIQQEEQQTVVATKTFHENDFNAPIAKLLGAKSEVKLKNGIRVDCMTDTFAYEVEWGKKLYEGIGQSLTYAHFTRKLPGVIVLLGDDADRKRFDLLKEVMEGLDMEILVYKVNKTSGSVKFLKTLSRTAKHV